MRPMQDIQSVVPLAPLSPNLITESAEVQQIALETAKDNAKQNLHEYRIALEQDVANLTQELTHELHMHEALEGGLQRTLGALPRIHGHIPAKTRELLFEVALLEEEIDFLEKCAVFLHQELNEESGISSPESKELHEQSCSPSEAAINDMRERSESEQLDDVISVRPSQYRTAVHEGNIPLPLPLPPNPSLSSPTDVDGQNRTPTKPLMRKQVIHKGSSSSESFPTNLDQATIDTKPLGKKVNHMGSAPPTKPNNRSNISMPRKGEDHTTFYPRRSSTKKESPVRVVPLPSEEQGNAAVRRSKGIYKGTVPSRSPPTKLENQGKRSTSKFENHPCSEPSMSSPTKFEDKRIAFMRSSPCKNEVYSIGPVSSPNFIDKGVSFVRRTSSKKELLEGSSLIKLEDPASINNRPCTEKLETHDGSIDPCKFSVVEKENVQNSITNEAQQVLGKTTLQDDQIVVSDIPPPIQSLTVVNTVDKVPGARGGVHRKHVSGKSLPMNIPSKPGCVKTMQLGTPTRNRFKVSSGVSAASTKGHNQGQKTSPNMDAKILTAAKIVSSLLASSNEISGLDLMEDDEKVDKVGMLCSPIADAAWLTEDLARLLGTFCSKLRQSASITDSLTTSPVPKTPVAFGRGSERFPEHQRNQFFDIRSSASLKMLQDCCTNDMDKTNSYGLNHPRKTMDLGPHRHYYKSITTPLEQKLKS
ncbi:hypothetical protein BDL97_04G123300 [Sphagnum fallax]|nr:hypothetical protein BDL97_04G123300 [Sphagnum fallax]